MSLLRACTIDIGSNTTLYLLGEISPRGQVYPLYERLFDNGIGKDVFTSGEISPQTFEKNLEILRNLIFSAKRAGAENIIAVGTSALRNAKNNQELLDLIRKELKLVIEIIDGDREAQLTYKGYISGEMSRNEPILLSDIGGGSCKFIWGEGLKIKKAFNLEIGAVRLHRLFKVSDPPDKAAIFTMRRFTKAYLKKQAFKRSDSLVFSGGTATTLSALKLGLKSYSASAVEGCELSEEWLENILAEFLQLNLAQRKELLHIDPERAEVIIGGCVIMLELLARLRLNKCRVTNRGLRYGLLYEWGEKERIKDKG